jgi:hypothetical protein
MAIGQLNEYRRFHELLVRLAVLLPYQPNPDGLALLQSAGIEGIWPHGAGFRDSANGTFVEQTTGLPRSDLAQRETLGRLGRVSGRLKRSSQSDAS